MLYVPLFARIQSQSSITSSETIFALGAPPAAPTADPAAIPATNVPCPRPSPGEFGVVLARFTWAATRLPQSKSARFASIPESTTAIVGACGAELLLEPQR